MLDLFIAQYEGQIADRATLLSRARDPLLHEQARKGRNHRVLVQAATVRNVRGCGCVFTIELPVVAPSPVPARSH